MNIPDHISERLETIFWVKILWCGCGSGILFDSDGNLRSGMEKFGSGINIPAATLL
jgi:hypothetical protein